MYNFKIEDKEFSIPTDWSEVPLKTYIDIVRLERTKEDYKIAELYLIKMIELLVGDNIDDLPLEDLSEMMKVLQYITIEPVSEKTITLKIGEKDYVFKEDMNKLSTGEYISIKVLQEGKDELDSLPDLLAVILRPGELVDGKWIQEKFNADDIPIRRRLILEQPITKLLGYVGFFLNGKDL